MNKKVSLDIERLKRLEPVSSLSEERLEELVPLTDVEHLEAGASLFREGDIDNQTVYLLAGDVQLTSSDGKVNKIVTQRSEAARHPLDDSQPRQVSGSALTRVEIVRIDNSVLDYMMMWDQMAVSESSAHETGVPDSPAAAPAESGPAAAAEPATPEPAPGGEDRSWIRKMRHIMAFKSMPPANIKRLLERMESVPVRKGEQIIEQGEPGEYYYVLTEGKAKVTRTVELATLEAGRSFGEEALLSGSKRNASVTMETDGMVMRLSKEDFNELLKEPMLERISPGDARLRIAAGAKWLDVRHAKEYHHSHLPDAINIPLHELRLRFDELDKMTSYICYCGTGRRSSAAAFLLTQKGFKVSVLNGGVQVMASDLRRGD
jgi:CRP-like cAMP-binding protein